jgi:ectoine hydroxylase-related dioxygenase (phytanoyl-CoA dioxygenase family)
MPVGEIRKAVTSYRKCGFAVLENAFAPELLDAAESSIDDREREWEAEVRKHPGGRSWISHADEITFTARLAGHEPALAALLTSPTLLEFLAATVGATPRLYLDQAVYKKPWCRQVVPWHQDDGYNPKVPDEYVTFWIAISDTTASNGTLRVRPGTNRRLLPHSRTAGGYLACEDGADGGELVELRRGDVAAFSSLLPHATGPNDTGDVRKAYIAICIPDGAKLVSGSPCNDPVTQPVLTSEYVPRVSTTESMGDPPRE